MFEAHGGVVTVVLAAPSAVDDAAQQLQRRWRNARRVLLAEGASEEELDSLDQTVAELHHDGGPAVVIIRPKGGPTAVEFLPTPVQSDLAVVDELARLGPILESRQQLIPHMMVVADRAGADIIGIYGDSTQEVQVEGDRLHLHRTQQGGWSQRRYQQRTENRWESNAAAVAEEVARMARELDARLVTVGGDVRAVGFMLEHMAADVAGRVHKLDGQSPDAMAEETVREAAGVVAADTVAVIERFRDALPAGLATDDLRSTFAALTEGRVETLLVHDDVQDDRRARFSVASTWCAADGDSATVPPSGEEVADARAVDVAIRSALLGGAQVRFVPSHGGPTERVGAVLRW